MGMVSSCDGSLDMHGHLSGVNVIRVWENDTRLDLDGVLL